jgi:hypothetical protein
MIRPTLVATVILIAVAPAVQAASCKEQLADVEKLMDSAINASQKQEAAKDVEMAKQALAKEDEDGCILDTKNARTTLRAE